MSLVSVTTGMTVLILALLSGVHRYVLGEYHDRGGCVRGVLFAVLDVFKVTDACFKTVSLVWFVVFVQSLLLFFSVKNVDCVRVGGGGECPPASCQTCILMTTIRNRTVDSWKHSEVARRRRVCLC